VVYFEEYELKQELKLFDTSEVEKEKAECDFRKNIPAEAVFSIR